MKRFLLAFLCVCAAACAAHANATNAIPWRVGKYSLIARQMALREAFDTFGVTEGLSVVMSEQVQGAFSGDFVDMPAQEFLERVCTMHNLTWYYDGAALYICSAGEVESQLVDLTYMKAGDVRAKIVLKKLTYDTIKNVGAYIAEMDGVDLIVFTAGIGENNPRLRRHVCENLSYMGVKIDAEANDGARSSETIISAPDSTVKVALIPTNEELVIARDTMHIVSELEN